MAVYFSGTNTGQFYQAGKVYSNGNGSYVANADGSFTNLNTGRTAVGSSQSDKVTFVVTSSLGASGSGAGQSSASTGGKAAASAAGPGKAVVVSPNAPVVGVPTAGPGVPAVKTSGGTVLGGGFLTPVAGQGPKQVTRLYFDGIPVPIDLRTSDGGDAEQRWGEWGGGIAGIGVMLQDTIGQTEGWKELVKGSDAALDWLRSYNNQKQELRAWEANPTLRLETWEADWDKRRDTFDLSGPGL